MYFLAKWMGKIEIQFAMILISYGLLWSLTWFTALCVQKKIIAQIKEIQSVANIQSCCQIIPFK